MAIKFALKVININRQAPNLQLGLGTNYDVGTCIDSSTHLLQCSALILFRHWTTSLRSHVRYAHADRVFSCPRSFTSEQSYS